MMKTYTSINLIKKAAWKSSEFVHKFYALLRWMCTRIHFPFEGLKWKQTIWEGWLHLHAPFCRRLSPANIGRLTLFENRNLWNMKWVPKPCRFKTVREISIMSSMRCALKIKKNNDLCNIMETILIDWTITNEAHMSTLRFLLHAKLFAWIHQ